ncbi:hypothetical protein D3C76_1629360 [compost metagenome]
MDGERSLISKVTSAVALLNPSETVYLNLAKPVKPGSGINSIYPSLMEAVPPTSSLTLVIVRVCVSCSFGLPTESLPVRSVNSMVTLSFPFAIEGRTSSVAIGK